MKNFKSLLLAVAVAAGALFTSCTEDTASTVTVKLDAVSFSDSVEIKGSITAAAGLESVMLLKDDATVRTIKSFTTGEITTKSDGVYTVALNKLVAGNYKLRATDKNANEHTFAFTVTAPAVATPVLTALANNITIYNTPADGITYSTCASATGITYKAGGLVEADQAKIDFVYYNGNGTTWGPHTTMYAPNSTPAGTTTTGLTAITNWTVKNATKFSKQTTSIYSTTDYAAVKLIADAATATSAPVLVIGDEYVFKTAGNKVGIFKVVNVGLATDYSNTANVVISIKVQN